MLMDVSAELKACNQPSKLAMTVDEKPYWISPKRKTNPKTNNEGFSVLKLSKEFARNTSIHGLKFIAQDHTSLLERIFWIILFLVGLFFALFFAWNLWDNWVQSPVLITIQTVNYPIKSYPFPAVTICSVNKVSTRALGEWMATEEAKDFKVNEIRRILEIMSTGLNWVENEGEFAVLGPLLLQANITSNDNKYEKLMKKLSPNCSKTIVFCSWEGLEEDCADLFVTQTADDGCCCSFNSVIIQRESDTYSNNQQSRLRHARTSGVQAGLTVLLDAELDDYNVTSSSIDGFKVSIQDPMDFPQTSRKGFLASPGFQINAAVTGYTQRAEDHLKVIDLKKRLCTTSQEITLKYFKNYTRPYCQLDCLTRFFLAECFCVPYYFPVPTQLPVCNISSYPCLQRISESKKEIDPNVCYCPDVCTTVWYKSEISTGTFPNSVWEYPPTVIDRPEFRNMNQTDLKIYAKKNFVKLNVYFQWVTGLCYIMKERTTWSDFLSATGGLLGLGFGFSILSAAEIFYFFLVRWCFRWYQSKKQKPSPTSPVPKLIHVRPFAASTPASITADNYIISQSQMDSDLALVDSKIKAKVEQGFSPTCNCTKPLMRS